MKKTNFVLVGVLSLGLCFSVGAATGAKISAELRKQVINVNGKEMTKDVIVYNKTTYLPLREAGDLVGTKVNYKKGVIYLGEMPAATDEKVAEKTDETAATDEKTTEKTDETVATDEKTTEKTDETVADDKTAATTDEAAAEEKKENKKDQFNKVKVTQNGWTKVGTQEKPQWTNQDLKAVCYAYSEDTTDLKAADYLDKVVKATADMTIYSSDVETVGGKDVVFVNASVKDQRQMRVYVIYDGGEVVNFVFQQADNGSVSLKDELLKIVKENL